MPARMMGVVERAAVEKALSDRADKTFMRFSGIIGGEELRSMPAGIAEFATPGMAQHEHRVECPFRERGGHLPGDLGEAGRDCGVLTDHFRYERLRR